jgi:hypothetical protein
MLYVMLQNLILLLLILPCKISSKKTKTAANPELFTVTARNDIASISKAVVSQEINVD